jgi:hypothetical protein
VRSFCLVVVWRGVCIYPPPTILPVLVASPLWILVAGWGWPRSLWSMATQFCAACRMMKLLGPCSDR